MTESERAAQWLLWASRLMGGLVMALILAVPSRGALLEDLGAPQLMMKSGAGMQPALMTDTRLQIDIVGEGAEAVVTQTFSNPSDDWMNAVYALPVPDRAAVRGLVLELDGRKIVGSIEERAAAKQQYRDAAERGQRASLLEQISPDLFHLNVANIAPKGVVKVTLRLSLTTERSGEWLSLRFPTTVTPKYRLQQPNGPLDAKVISDTAWAERWVEWQTKTADLGADMPTGPLLAEPGQVLHPLDWQVTLHSHGEVAQVVTPQHNGRVRRWGAALRVDPRFGPAEMDRDFVVRWRLKPAAVPTPSLLLSQQQGEAFAELAVLPPQPEYLPEPPPRELLLVLDVSGSMAGKPLAQAVAAASAALEQLRPMDLFDIVIFESKTTTLFGELVAAAPNTIAEAQGFLRVLEAEGGTEMLPALIQALDYGPVPEDALRQVLFVTDGAVWGEAELFRMIAERLDDSRLFTLAIGSAPNTRFMRRAAQVGRGLYRHVDGSASVAAVLSELLARMSQPVLSDIRIDWPVPVEAAGIRPGDLYLGEPLRQRVRLLAPVNLGEVVVSGVMDGRRWQVAVPLDARQNRVMTHEVLAARWAQERIDWLLDGALVTGQSQDVVRDDVLALGLDYALLTPFTSFVAVEERMSRPPSLDAGRYWVSNAVPAGAVRFAQTAIGVELWLYFGLAAVLLGALGWAVTRESES